MYQWLLILASALLIGGICAWRFASRCGLLVALGLWWIGVAVWLFLSPPGDLWWPIPLFWIGGVGSVVIYAIVRLAARRAS